MKYLALTLPGGKEIEAPVGVPTGGFYLDTQGNETLSWALNVLFAIASVLVLFMIVWGGIQWLTSGGDKEKIANARKRIMYSILGLVVIVLSVLIVDTLLYFLSGGSLFYRPYANPCDIPGEPC